MRYCPRSWFLMRFLMRFLILNEVLGEVLDSRWGSWGGSWFSMRFLVRFLICNEVLAQDLIEILILEQSHWDFQREKQKCSVRDISQMPDLVSLMFHTNHCSSGDVHYFWSVEDIRQYCSPPAVWRDNASILFCLNRIGVNLLGDAGIYSWTKYETRTVHNNNNSHLWEAYIK